MVQEIQVTELNEAPYNPRVKIEPGTPEWEKLERSIREFGNVEPVVWNKRTGNVVGGHQRLAVLKSMGYEAVPCSVVDMDEKEEKLLNVALNKIKGKWDYDKLEKILGEFDYEDAEASGFSADEIALLLSDDSDLMDWDEDGQEEDGGQVFGGSYIVTLIFASWELAKEWSEDNGYKGQVKKNSSTTVIRIEE